ncbi:MAG: hypothetical protein KTR30_39155 [Saprospiraceae bacterium]|nr:hypothetical protein [Saprospiraceae bacterium]
MKYLRLVILLVLGSSHLFLSCSKEDDCVETLWYEDADGDGLGNAGTSISACTQPDGYVSDSSDDDDSSGNSATIATYGDALADQIAAGDGNGIDNSFRISGLVINETTNTYFAVNGVHPINSGNYTAYYPKSVVEASLETDEIVNAWSFDASTLGRDVDMEALCFAENTSKLYIGDEYNFIYELDLSSGSVTREWNLAAIGISTNTDKGVEALTYLNGHFYAGIQDERRIYQLDLHLDATDPGDSDYQTVESLSSFAVNNSPSGLFAGQDGSLYMVAFGGGDVNQYIYNYTTNGTLSCTFALPSSVDIQQADGIYIDSNEEYAYIADSQGSLNGLYSVYRVPWNAADCQ